MEKVVNKELLSCFDSFYYGVIFCLFNCMEDSCVENVSYSMVDVLKSGFVIYLLKCVFLFFFCKCS